MMNLALENYGVVEMISQEFTTIDGGNQEPPSCITLGATDAAQGKPFDNSCNGTAYWIGYYGTCLIQALSF